MALRTQMVGHGGGQIGLVLDDQKSPPIPPACRGPGRADRQLIVRLRAYKRAENLAGTDMHPQLWILVGLLGQLFFTSRFLVQWIASERAGRSIVPQVFWLFSLAGGVLLLVYALWRRDPVFIAGQSAGLVVYLRNLMLIARQPEPAR